MPDIVHVKRTSQTPKIAKHQIPSTSLPLFTVEEEGEFVVDRFVCHSKADDGSLLCLICYFGYLPSADSQEHIYNILWSHSFRYHTFTDEALLYIMENAQLG